jgi:hypothetical protein
VAVERNGQGMALGILYMVLTLCAGMFFYWLRNNHRILYGTSEILAALALMYFMYFPHGGPVLLTGGYIAPTWLDVTRSKSVGFFASVYGFVRGCDNIGTELRA